MIYEGDDEEGVGLGETGGARTLSGMGLLGFGLAPVCNDRPTASFSYNEAVGVPKPRTTQRLPCLSCGMRLPGETKTWKKSNEGCHKDRVSSTALISRQLGKKRELSTPSYLTLRPKCSSARTH